ncbi:hypothetical protein FBALC1_02442 [Flavobacteriales bacterium ALC-1]|nr:hypothetical protein FBALC1_02442 [Flavobacteriales bacterium ALC-1]
MKNQIYILIALVLISNYSCAQESEYNSDNFKIQNVEVKHNNELSLTIWSINVKGVAGQTIPKEAGQLDGAPVLGYVFPTNLKPEDVGFSKTEGIVALALTSHPDFDDTPLWDENSDNVYNNDGVIWHPHWVILTKDERVKGGLAVKQFRKEDENVILPPTNPGMPMYMDSPGYAVTTDGSIIKVVVPDYRISHKVNFKYDGVAAFMKVNTSNDELPMLGVYDVFSVASGDLSLPYSVKED